MDSICRANKSGMERRFRMKNRSYITVALCFFYAGCSLRRGVKDHYEIKIENEHRLISEAKQDFDEGDYENAALKFKKLCRGGPKDALFCDYYSQAILGRSGIDIFNIIKKVREVSKSSKKHFDLFTGVMEILPPVSEGIREGFSESIRVLLEYRRKYSDSYLKKNEILYRIVYIGFLLKSISGTVNEKKIRTLDSFMNFKKDFLKENSEIINNLLNQFKILFNLLESYAVSKSLKDQFYQRLNKEEITFNYQGRAYRISFKNGFKEGLNEFINSVFDKERIIYIRGLFKVFKNYMQKIHKEEVTEFKENLEIISRKVKREMDSIKDLPIYDKLNQEFEQLRKK